MYNNIFYLYNLYMYNLYHNILHYYNNYGDNAVILLDNYQM